MQPKVSLNGTRAANSGAHFSNGSANIGAFYTVADVAALLELKAQPNGKYHGAPGGTGATKDGFVLCPEGNAFTNGGDKFTSRQVAELAGIEPGQYEPVAAWKDGRGLSQSNGAHSSPQRATAPPKDGFAASAERDGADTAPKLPKAPFDWKRAQTFDYLDEGGALLFQVGRCDAPGYEKSIRQRQPNGRGAWMGKLDGARRVLWRLPDVLGAETVWLCEGEKAATALNEAFERAGTFGRHVATTNPQGAGKWRAEFGAPLDGKAVAVLPDFDAPGDKHGADVCGSIYARGQIKGGAATSLKRLDLPDLPPKGDVCDWLDAGGTVAQLLELLDGARQWEPDRKAAPEKPAPYRPKISTARELMEREIPPAKWIAPGLIAEGLTIFAGNPKLGKSWAMLGLALAVACGGCWLGNIQVERGDVLYLALEDNERRMKTRLTKCLQGAPAPENFHYATEWRRLDEGGTGDLIEWLEAHPNARLIVVDTLQKVKPRRRGGGNAYEQDSDDIGALKTVADRYGVAVVAVHHRRKGQDADDLEAVSGSYGLTGAADGILSLARERGKSDAVLKATGRDLEEEREIALQFDSVLGSWKNVGDAEEFRLSAERAAILEAIADAGAPLLPKEIADATGQKPANVRYLLHAMHKDGQAVGDNGGRYDLPATANVANAANAANVANTGANAANTFHAQNGALPLGLPLDLSVSAGDSSISGTVSGLTNAANVSGISGISGISGVRGISDKSKVSSHVNAEPYKAPATGEGADEVRL